ncbi:MAG: ATP-grasp domain-containing protein [Alphaproteobacteria bacterium]
MLLLEHEGKAVLGDHGIPVPRGKVVASAGDVEAAVAALRPPFMVKAQVAAGGRGKAGGVVRAADAAEAGRRAGDLLGGRLRDLAVDAVLVEEQAAIRAERYLAVMLDGGRPICLIGRKGGIEVESLFDGEPDGFRRIEIDPAYGLGPYQVRAALDELGIDPACWSAFSDIATKAASLLRSADATLIEINPLAELTDGSLLALDARISIDDGALFRQPRFAAIERARVAGDDLQVRMKALEIQYVPVGGSIGLVSSGAGVGVTVMDWVERLGCRLSAFVDLDYAIMSGKTDPALHLVLDVLEQDPKVEAIIVNFTTCGLRLDHLAESLMRVLGERPGTGSKPLFFHLQGNRAPAAHKLLRGAGYAVCEAIGDAVRGAVGVVGKVAA